MVVHVGYMELPDVPAALRMLARRGHRGRHRSGPGLVLPVQPRTVPGDNTDMAPWRKRLFIATSYITADAAGHFDLPQDRTVLVGSRMEV